MKRLYPAALAAISGLLVAIASPARADEKAGYPALTKMLEVGWGPSAQFRAAGDKQAEAALAAGGRSQKALYALAVVNIKQGRYADAQKSIDELLSGEAGHLPGLRARVWLAAILKNYDGAMAAAEKLAEMIPAADADNKVQEAENRELVAFLGRIYGFLGGPAAAAVKASDRKASERKLLAGLPDERRVVFEEARDGVLQKHLELTDAKDATTDAAKEAAEDAKAKTLEEIASQRQERAARLKELEERSDKLKSEIKDEMAQIAKEDRPLLAELAQLERRAGTINRELLSIQGQIGGLQNFLDREEDPGQRQRFLNEIDRLVLIGSRYDADLRALNRLAAGVQSQRAGLADRQRKVQADVGSQLKRINDEANELARREKRAGAIEKRAERTTAATPAAALSLRATAAALATYDPFPLEQEKGRILEGLK